MEQNDQCLLLAPSKQSHDSVPHDSVHGIDNKFNKAYSSIVRNETTIKIPVMYSVVCVLTTLVIVFVFIQPSIQRLMGGDWQRGRFIYEWSLSLDVHAAYAFLFVFVLVFQYVMGIKSLNSNNGHIWHKLHLKTGKLVTQVLFPIFMIIVIWVIINRGMQMDVEKSVIFKLDTTIVLLILAKLAMLTSAFFIRAIVAIKRGDVRLHVDSLIMFYIILGGVAYLRLIYVVLWAIWGRTSLTLLEVYYITISFMIALMMFAFILAKRLKHNVMPLLSAVIGTVAIHIATLYV